MSQPGPPDDADLDRAHETGLAPPTTHAADGLRTTKAHSSRGPGRSSVAPMSDPHPHANHHQHVAALDSQAQILDLDAEVMADHIAAVAAWLPVQAAPVEIVDLGAGTGAGSFALLTQFPEAHVTAVDSSAAHLDSLRTKARTANLSDRLRIVQADLDASEWPDLGAPDLVWASASMHHLADPDRALRNFGAPSPRTD